MCHGHGKHIFVYITKHMYDCTLYNTNSEGTLVHTVHNIRLRYINACYFFFETIYINYNVQIVHCTFYTMFLLLKTKNGKFVILKHNIKIYL